jgi:flagellar biosynthetic protein FliO
MKAVLMKLSILALFLPYAFGQAVPSSSPAQSSGISSGAGIAAGPTPTAPAAEAQEVGMHFPVIRTLGGMGLVLCLMIGIYLAVKKFAPRCFPGVAGERNLKVIETQSMGERRSIALIEACGNRFLIGSTPQQINLLAALPEPISLVSDRDAEQSNPKEKGRSEVFSPFRKLFDAEKKGRPQSAVNVLPEEVRVKMRQLREALER